MGEKTKTIKPSYTFNPDEETMDEFETKAVFPIILTNSKKGSYFVHDPFLKTRKVKNVGKEKSLKDSSED